MSQVNVPVLAAQCPADVTGDDQVHVERGVSGQVEEEVIESRKMADPKRHRRNWTRRWKITGDLRKMVMELRRNLLKMMST
jgi:hypothetical protein